MSNKILGNFIRKVDNKNKDMKVLNLLGLSMTKEFRKSTSNIVGTDLSKYKIVKQGQFCCDFMSVIRVHKLPVVLNNLGEDVIISPAYIVFEVIDENHLLPEYLMLWFRRTEFDRYADFRCDSSIRGGFQWEELCEVELPVPTIEKQRENVAQYQAVENKIKVNEQICEKLEATAQTLYKQWFVDFEFPNEEGQPYKSSGGAMVFNLELEKEIPEGWEKGTIKKIANKIYSGGTPSTDIEEYWNGKFDWLSSGETGIKFILSTERTITELGVKNSTTKLAKRYNTVIATAGQGKTRGQSAFLFTDVYINQSVISIEPIFKQASIFIFLNINNRYDELRNNSDAQSIRGSINSDDIKNLELLIPNDKLISEFYKLVQFDIEMIQNYKIQNQKLTQLQSLLLSRLATLEG